jgi:dTDP-glucose pyrophosphorylase
MYMHDDIIGLIPSAGKGTRLYPFAMAVPKEMYPILGKAVIEHCIENLRVGGVNNIFVVVGHQKGALIDYIGDGSFFGVNVSYIYQTETKGLGHAILQGRKWIDKSFVVMLGDSFIEPKDEIKKLISLHKEKKPIASLILFSVENPEGYGIVKLKDMQGSFGVFEKVIEKPSAEEAESFRTNGKFYAICGAYVFEPKIFDYIQRTAPGAKGEIQITDAIALALQNGETAYGLVLEGKYLDIGKWHTVLKTEKELMNSSDIDHHIKEREQLMETIKSVKEEK